MSKTEQRKEYLNGTLIESEVSKCPIEQFETWFTQAASSKVIEPNAMNIATVDAEGRPSSRTVLLREFSEDGFIFYTNYESQKGQEIAGNPKVALCFYWDALERQVRISADVKKISREASEEYFRNRPQDAQVSAYISSQSSVVKDRKTLEALQKEALEFYEGKQVPLPDSWGGFVAVPNSFEFWQGRRGRLHDRLIYSQSDSQECENGWKIERLCP